MNGGERIKCPDAEQVSSDSTRSRPRRAIGISAGHRWWALALVAGALLNGARDSSVRAQSAGPSSSPAPQMPLGSGSSANEPANASPSPGNRVLRMLGFTQSSPNAPGAKPSALTNCPDIVIDGGAAELRDPPAADASSVRYQIAISRMARECALNGRDIAVKVGIQGAAVLGPVGQPGAYYGNLRVALRRKRDGQLFAAKTFRVGATIPSGAARADFNLLVEGLSAPFISPTASEDYEVVVGFGQGAEKPVKTKVDRVKRK